LSLSLLIPGMRTSVAGRRSSASFSACCSWSPLAFSVIKHEPVPIGVHGGKNTYERQD
jgi:hypothetical protein